MSMGFFFSFFRIPSLAPHSASPFSSESWRHGEKTLSPVRRCKEKKRCVELKPITDAGKSRALFLFFASLSRRTRGRERLPLELLCRRQTDRLSLDLSPLFQRPAPKQRLPLAPKRCFIESRERERESRKRERGGGKKTLVSSSSSFSPCVSFLFRGSFFSSLIFPRVRSSLTPSPLLPLPDTPTPSFLLPFFPPSAGALAQSATQNTQAQTATNEAIAELAVASIDATTAAAAPALAVAAAAETTSAAAANAAAASVPAEPRVIEVVTAEPQLAVSEVSAPATLEISATPAAVASAAAATETVPAAAATPQALTNEGPPPQDLSLPLTYYEWSGLYVKRTPDG